MNQHIQSSCDDIYPPDMMRQSGSLRVRLSSVGNPDFGQNPNCQMLGAEANRWQEVGSIDAASAACRKFISDNQLGGGNWTGGEVQDADGKVVAHISYNGRAWLPGNQLEV